MYVTLVLLAEAAVDGRMEIEGESSVGYSIGYSSSNVDISDVRQLEALLAWDAAQVESVGIEAIDGVGRKRRRLDPSPIRPAGGVGMDTASSNSCYHLAGTLVAAMHAEEARDEAAGNSPGDYCGLLSFFKHTVVHVLQTVEECQHADRQAPPAEAEVAQLGHLVSAAGLALSLAIAADRPAGGEGDGDGDGALVGTGSGSGAQIECLKSLLFYVYVLAVDSALLACGEAGDDDTMGRGNRQCETLLASIVSSAARLMGGGGGGGGRLCQFSGFAVPEGQVIEFMANATCRCSALLPRTLRGGQDDSAGRGRQAGEGKKRDSASLSAGAAGGGGGGGEGPGEQLLRVLSALHFPRSGHLSASFWSDASASLDMGREGSGNAKSPFPLMEAQWPLLDPLQRAAGVCLCMDSLLEVAGRAKVTESIAAPPAASPGREEATNCSEEEDSQAAPRAPGPGPPCRDDGLVAAAVWLCRAASACLSSRGSTSTSTTSSAGGAGSAGGDAAETNARVVLLLSRVVGK
jgi:hypothetical protein